MHDVTQIWNIIVTSNTFNIVVMVILLAFIVKKYKILQILDKARENVINSIEQSKIEKENAKTKLEEANNLIKNLDSEISSTLKEAEKQGEFLSKNISNDADSRIANITGNIERVIQSEEKTVSTRLSRKAAAAAVYTAKAHICEILKNSPDKHNKYIQESINELDRIQF